MSTTTMPTTAAIPSAVAPAPLPVGRQVIQAFGLGVAPPADEELLNLIFELTVPNSMAVDATTAMNANAPGEHPIADAVRAHVRASTARASVIERIDDWVAKRLPQDRNARLHTESLGHLLDRMANHWVWWRRRTGPEEEHLLRDLAELNTAYDDVISDVHAGRLRLRRRMSVSELCPGGLPRKSRRLVLVPAAADSSLGTTP